MTRHVVRVWLPDLPGALGRVATAIGTAGASLVGVDILEQGGGWAIDELVVDIAGTVDELVAALVSVEGVSVETVRSARVVVDPRLDALETAAELVEQRSPQSLAQTLVKRACHDMDAEWVALLAGAGAGADKTWMSASGETGGQGGQAGEIGGQAGETGQKSELVLAAAGIPPSVPWLKAFVAGSQSSAELTGGNAGPEDIAWSALVEAGASLVVGRSGRPFRARERLQLAALVRIADRRLVELAG